MEEVDVKRFLGIHNTTVGDSGFNRNNKKALCAVHRACAKSQMLSIIAVERLATDHRPPSHPLRSRRGLLP